MRLLKNNKPFKNFLILFSIYNICLFLDIIVGFGIFFFVKKVFFNSVVNLSNINILIPFLIVCYFVGFFAFLIAYSCVSISGKITEEEQKL